MLLKKTKTKRILKLFSPEFPQQKAFCEDPSKQKALFCTRRAAKSYTFGLYAVSEALKHPNSNILLIGLTRASAKGIFWKDILRVINKRCKLRARFNKAELTMTLRNGSLIAVTGIDADESDMLKLLGRKYRLVCIDEGSMYTIDLRNFVYGVLGPAMSDEEGTICIGGTASNYPRGLFYDITKSDGVKESGWSLHSWSAHNNPFQAVQWQKKLDLIKTGNPLYMETPQFKQWYLNQWIVDTEKLVYRFSEARNIYSDLPVNLNPTGWIYVLGVDLGWEDDNAFVLCAYHENDPNMYVVKTFNKSKMTFDKVCDKINEFIADKAMSPSKVVIDGANKQGVETMKVRSNGIPFEYADKTGKFDFIEMLNADMIQAKIKIQRQCTTLIDELMGLVVVTKDGKTVLPKKENPACANHLCDAYLYAWRNSYHYHSSPATVSIPVGSKAWYEKQAEDIWEREKEHLINKDNGDWPDDSGGFGKL